MEDEEETSDDDSCDESDTDDEEIPVMSGDNGETVSDLEGEEQNIDDLNDEENNIVCKQACAILLKIGQGLRELSDQRGTTTSGHIYQDTPLSAIIILIL